MIFGHLCGFYGKKPNPTKVDAIGRMKEDCSSLTEVHRFIGAYVYYCIWILHYAYIADLLYELLRKGYRFKWEEKYVKALQRLPTLLISPPVLKNIDYKSNRLMICIVNTSLIAIGWAVGHNDSNGHRLVV